jgi:hypothetical protein
MYDFRNRITKRVSLPLPSTHYLLIFIQIFNSQQSTIFKTHQLIYLIFTTTNSTLRYHFILKFAINRVECQTPRYIIAGLGVFAVKTAESGHNGSFNFYLLVLILNKILNIYIFIFDLKSPNFPSR